MLITSEAGAVVDHVYTLAFNNKLMLLGRQTMPLHQKRGKKEMVRSDVLRGHYSVIPAVGDVSRHREMMTKCSSLNINVTLTRDFSTDSTELFPSDEVHISCVSDGAKTPSGECTHSDANQVKFLQITAVSINFSNQIFQYKNQKQFMETRLKTISRENKFYKVEITLNCHLQ